MKYYLIAEEKKQGKRILECDGSPKMISDGGSIWYRSVAYDSREKLLEDQKVMAEPCRECGGVVSLNILGSTKRLESRNICSLCDHFIEIIEDINNPRRVIVNGGCYWRKDYNKTAPSHCLGFGGSVYKIRMHTGEEYTTNDLWFNGEIPEIFRDRIKDNAVFIGTL